MSPLNAILDVDAAGRAGWPPLDLLRAFLDGGATFIQLRAKTLESGPLLELCDAAVAISDPFGAQIVVNDRVDVAAMGGAAGVHLGQDDLPPSAARVQLGDDAIVGMSTHSVAQIEAAVREPISYLAIGPVFGTQTKQTGYDAVGLDLVRFAATAAGSLPVVAIGGVTLDTAAAVLDAGASSVAVIGDLLVTGTPRTRVAEYLRALAR